MTSKPNRRILIVDDSPAIHDDFHKILGPRRAAAPLADLESQLFGDAVVAETPERYLLESAHQGREAVAMAAARAAAGAPYALAFVDMRMPPGWDGVKTIEELWRVDGDLQVVVCTAYSDDSWVDMRARLGANDRMLILKKPFDPAEVAQLALALTEKWNLARQAHLKLDQLETVVRGRTEELHSANELLRHEIAERKQLETSLRKSESRYALAAAAANDGLWDWDLESDVVFYSPRWRMMLGYQDCELGTTPAEWLDRVAVDDLPALERAIDDHLSGRSPQLAIEYRIRHRDGQMRWVACRGLAVHENGRPVRLAGSQSDVTERRLAEQRLRYDALHDSLTGLANRALFADRLRQSLLRYKRKESATFAVLFLDLDRFKAINDSLGHQAGDEILIGIAHRLAKCVRASDAVSQPAPGNVARLGGDEFVVLLDELRSEADGFRVAERIIAAVAEPFTIGSTSVTVGASVGIAFAHHDYGSPDALLRDADIALYQAKSRGKGRYEVFNREMHSSALTRWRLENDLRHAIERGELSLVYQPIVCARTSQTEELEALLRWNHPQWGAISPAEFIPVAEETGLIVPLGAWVLRQACEQLARWDRLWDRGEVSVAVNVSSRQLTQPGFADMVAEVLRDTGISARRLHLELTETALLHRDEAMTRLMARLRELDLRLHLDDFGVGYSSLSYLHQLPVQALKIDRSFVGTLGTNSTSVSIVQAIVALGHALGMQVIAEGVETAEQLALVRELRCDRAQGYHFSAPMPAADVSQLLGRRRLAAVV